MEHISAIAMEFLVIRSGIWKTKYQTLFAYLSYFLNKTQIMDVFLVGLETNLDVILSFKCVDSSFHSFQQLLIGFNGDVLLHVRKSFSQ